VSEPTRAELVEQLAEQKAKVKALDVQYQQLDPEARAYARCVSALSTLKSQGSYASSSPVPDRDAIRRILDTLASRFGVEQSESVKGSDDYYVSQSYEMPDPTLRRQGA
jgi:hypothetical protein